MSATANPGDHSPALHDLAHVSGLDDRWVVVGLADDHGEVAQVQNTRTHAVFGVLQDEHDVFRLRFDHRRVWFAPAAGTPGAPDTADETPVRNCDLCGQPFVPDPFGDSEVCPECEAECLADEANDGCALCGAHVTLHLVDDPEDPHWVCSGCLAATAAPVVRL